MLKAETQEEESRRIRDDTTFVWISPFSRRHKVTIPVLVDPDPPAPITEPAHEQG